MTPLAIPEWDSSGLIPPICPWASGASPHRSPYKISLMELVERLGVSSARRQILLGFLEFRGKLHSLGMTRGVQWLDGSFVEHKEARQGKDPADIDVVTFSYLPEEETEESLFHNSPELFDTFSLKDRFQVDGYFMFLGQESDASLLKRISYWYSMWSHTREREWKGFFQVDLSPDQDEEACAFLRDLHTEL